MWLFSLGRRVYVETACKDKYLPLACGQKRDHALEVCYIFALSLCYLCAIFLISVLPFEIQTKSLCYLCAIFLISVLPFEIQTKSLCYLCAISVLSMLSNEIVQENRLCYLCAIYAIYVLSLCYLCAISVLSLCFLCAFSPLSGHYRSKFLYSDIPPLSQQARDAQCFVSLFVVKVSMPMLRMVHAKLLIKKHMATQWKDSWHVRSQHSLVFGRGRNRAAV